MRAALGAAALLKTIPLVLVVIAAAFGCSASSSTSPRAAIAGVVNYAFSPALGPPEGGTTVNIWIYEYPRLAHGTGFQPGTMVTFDGTAATSIRMLDDILISAIAPAHGAGTTDVVLVSPGGQKRKLGLYVYVDTVFDPGNGWSDCQSVPPRPPTVSNPHPDGAR